MARTAPVPNIPAIPGMNPGTWIMGGGGVGGGGHGSGDGSGEGQGGSGENGGNGAQGGGKDAAGCGPGSGGGCPNPAHGGGGGTHAGDPVDPITGRVYTTASVDLTLPGPLPLTLTRSYSSAARDVDVGLGPGWSHALAWAIEERRRTLRVLAPGAAPTLADRPEIGAAVSLPSGRLTRHAEGYTLEGGGLTRVFGERQGSRVLLSRLVDANGNMIELVYAQGRLAQIRDSVGRVVRVRRSSEGHIQAFEVKNASEQGRWTSFFTYAFDARGDLVTVTDAEGNAQQFSYDDDHRLVRRQEPGGLVAEFRYDGQGRCIESFCHRAGNDGLDVDLPGTLRDGLTLAKGFLHVKLDYGEGMTEVVTSRALRRVHGNALHKADKSVWAGGVNTYRYDGAGNLLEYADALNQPFRFRRDATGKLLASVDPLGAATEYTYDARGYIVAATDALGASVRYERDARGNVLAVYDEGGLVVEFRYDVRGLLIAATLPNGGVTRMDYDGLGNRVTVVEPDGGTRRIRYDFLGRVRSFVDERGFETHFLYDGMGRQVATRGPSGAVTRYDYDVDGNPSRITDADGRVTTLRWGGFRVVTEIVRPDGSVVRYRYDREQDLVRVVNEVGDEHVFQRGGEGRILEERTFDGRQIRYQHDALGRITQIREGHRLTEFAYDALGRLLERSSSDGTKDTFAYDALGRMVQAVRGEVESAFAYDARGRMVREETRWGGAREVTAWTYDAMGKAVRVEGPEGRIEVRRDVMGRPVEVLASDAGPFGFGYDAAGNEVERRLPGGGQVLSEVTPEGLLASERVLGPEARQMVRPGEPAWVGAPPKRVTRQRVYTWSAAGRKAATETESGDRDELLRDGNGRVVERRRTGRAGGAGERYAYGPSGDVFDDRGRRSYARGGRLEARGEARYRYDDLGRRVEKSIPGLTGEEVWSYDWSDDDRLLGVRRPDGVEVTFTYDAFARRVGKQVMREGRTVSATRYAWRGELVVREQRVQVRAEGDPVVEARVYLTLPGGLLPFAERVSSGGQAGATYAVVSGSNGFPEALLRGDGSVAAAVEGSLFGEVSAGEAGVTPRRYPGQYADEETGLVYNRYRYYEAETGQYLSPEPLRLKGSLKAYGYVDGYPTDGVDVDALMKCTITRTGDLDTITRNSGSKADIHPAVAAALPPSQARDPSLPNPPDVDKCAEPAALSEHLFNWEVRNRPKKCYPKDANDTQWRQNLSAALGEIKPSDGIASSDGNGAAAPCPNCGQTIPRLYALAGLKPPSEVTAPGRVTGVNPPAPPDADPSRQSPPAREYTEDKANAALNTDRAQAALNQASIKKASPKAVNYPEEDLGIWEHDGTGWQRKG